MQPPTYPVMPAPAPAPPPDRKPGWGTAVVLGVAVAVVVALVAAVLVTWRAVAPVKEPVQEPAAIPATRSAEVFVDLPSELSPPARVVDLPADRGVGWGALIYHRDVTSGVDLDAGTSEEVDVFLVTGSGEQFRVGRTSAGGESLDLSLSPDGRWLASRPDGQWRVRDLSGTAEHGLPAGAEFVFWSTHAGSLLLMQKQSGSHSYAVMTLPDGVVRPLGVPVRQLVLPVALVDGRELALVESAPYTGGEPSPAFTLALLDVVTGGMRSLRLFAEGELRSGEVPGPVVPLIQAGGDPATIWIQVGRPEGLALQPPLSILGVEVGSGARTGRIELPLSEGSFLTVLVDGVVLKGQSDGGTELKVLDLRTGTRRTVTTIQGTVVLVVPGTRY
ncbi:hypothetical protein ACK8GG_02320 [Micromonosporaceae bacterium DT55]|uniref:hypothetical protein n=1 Tax=Melissospora conviva TaxID=3388432 RepID=UPI003C1E5127